MEGEQAGVPQLRPKGCRKEDINADQDDITRRSHNAIGFFKKNERFKSMAN